MNPFLGVLIISIGSTSAASFYVPLGKVKGWAWETYYLAQGVIAWIIMPLIAALYATPQLFEVYTNSPPASLAVTFGLGVLWGVGALTFGLSMRYLGLSLGYAIALGFCAAVGTLAPSIIEGKFLSLFVEWPKVVLTMGVVVTLVGITVCGLAGIKKERELTEDEKKASIREFNLVRGLAVAVLSGVMASCFAIGLTAGKEIAETAVRFGASELYKNNTVFLVITLGGFFTNLVWCLFLGIKNKTVGDYVSGSGGTLVTNYLLVALAGTLWYAQFFFYGMGITKLGQYSFTAWSIHIALIIALSNLWGIALKEWKGISRTNWVLLWSGIAILVSSAFVIGLGNYLLGKT